MPDVYLDSTLDDWYIITEPFVRWVGKSHSQLSEGSKNLLMYTYIICDRCYMDEAFNPTIGQVIDDEENKVYEVILRAEELITVMNGRIKLLNSTLSESKSKRTRTREEIKLIGDTIGDLSSATVTTLQGEILQSVNFTRRLNYNINTGEMVIQINKEFINLMRNMTEFSKTYGMIETLTSYPLTPKELVLYSFICMNDKAIETQCIKGNIPYQGVGIRDLASLLGLSGRIDNIKRSIMSSLNGINKKLNLHLDVEFIYKGKSIKRVRFYCKEGGVHMGYYDRPSSKKVSSRVTNTLVALYKIRYRKYYEEDCPTKDATIHAEIRRSFKEVFALNIYSEDDRTWYEENVLDDLFKKYDDLGYSKGQKFKTGQLHVIWLMTNLVNGVANTRKDKDIERELTGKVGTCRDEAVDKLIEEGAKELANENIDWDEKY